MYFYKIGLVGVLFFPLIEAFGSQGRIPEIVLDGDGPARGGTYRLVQPGLMAAPACVDCSPVSSLLTPSVLPLPGSQGTISQNSSARSLEGVQGDKAQKSSTASVLPRLLPTDSSNPFPRRLSECVEVVKEESIDLPETPVGPEISLSPSDSSCGPLSHSSSHSSFPPLSSPQLRGSSPLVGRFPLSFSLVELSRSLDYALS